MGYLSLPVFICQHSLYPFAVPISLMHKVCQLQKNLDAFPVLLPT